MKVSPTKEVPRGKQDVLSGKPQRLWDYFKKLIRYLTDSYEDLANAINYNDDRRRENRNDIDKNRSDIDANTEELSNMVGIICLWSGTISEIPIGWVLCDGNNGTPDLTDKFILGVSDSSEDPGSTGGQQTHQHKTPVALDGGKSSNGMRVGDDDTGNNSNLWGSELGPTVSIKTDKVNAMHTGSEWALTDPRSNMPPYYVLAFIMKL
jgi:hypothetical protein